MPEKSTVEIVAEHIGFHATCELCARFGARTFYVPTRPHQGHILSLVLGHDKALSLGEAVGGQTIELPALREISKKRETDMVCRRLAAGESDRQILLTTELTQGQLTRIKSENGDLIEAYADMMDRQNSFIRTVKTK